MSKAATPCDMAILAMSEHGQDARATPRAMAILALSDHGQDARATSREMLGCELAAEVLRSWGKLRLRVTGASMMPALWPGDILSVRRQDAAEVVPGDIVLFGREGRLVAHRVVEVRRQEPGGRSQESEVRSQEQSPITNHQSPIAVILSPFFGRRTSVVRSAHWPLGTTGVLRCAQDDNINHQSPIANHQSQFTNHKSPMVTIVTRGDRVGRNDAPISSHELLGRVMAIERGSRRLTPRQSVASRLASWILSRSDLCTRLVLRLPNAWHGIRDTGLGIQD